MSKYFDISLWEKLVLQKDRAISSKDLYLTFRTAAEKMDRFETINIYYAYKPLFLLARLIGVMPFQIESQNGVRLVKLSLLSVCYSLIMTIFMLFRKYHLVLHLMRIDHLKSVFHTTSILEIITCNITSGLFFILNILNRAKIIRIFAMLAQFDEQIKFPLSSYRRSFIFVVGQLCFHFVYMGSIGIVNVMNTSLSHHNLIKYVSVMSNVLIIILVDLEILNFMLIFSQRFKVINLKLTEFININPTILRNTSKLPLTLLSDVINVKSFQRMSHMKFSYIATLHDRLCDICEIANSAYSIHILLNLTVKFIAIIFMFYFRLLRLLRYNTGPCGDPYEDVMMVATLCWNILQVFLLLWSCKQAAEEVRYSV